MSTLNMAATCCTDPKVARAASSCMLQACEAALNINMDIPQNIASGLLTAIQATNDPEVSCSTALLSSCHKGHVQDTNAASKKHESDFVCCLSDAGGAGSGGCPGRLSQHRVQCRPSTACGVPGIAGRA